MVDAAAELRQWPGKKRKSKLAGPCGLPVFVFMRKQSVSGKRHNQKTGGCVEQGGPEGHSPSARGCLYGICVRRKVT